MIRQGYIMVNGNVIRDHLYLVKDSDSITFSKMISRYMNQLGLILVNKPRGIFTNCKIGNDEKEVVDLLPKRYKNFSSIGRLDKDSEGLILFTNDGVYANQFLNSGETHQRVYQVWTKQALSPKQLNQLSTGVMLDDGLTLPATVTMINQNCYQFILNEGRNRQIRRMVEVCGTHVIRLKRLHFGDYSLTQIKHGHFLYLSLKQNFQQRAKDLLTNNDKASNI